MCLDFPPKMNNWERVDPIQLFTSPTEKKEANPKMKMNEVSDTLTEALTWRIFKYLSQKKMGEKFHASNKAFLTMDGV